MTPQIKQRIEQIRRGEVPEGYKRTKVGIVPDEWNEECLGKYLQEYKELSNDIENYPVYSSSRQGLIPQSQYYDNREAVETNLGYKIVPNGYVTYRHMSDDDIFHFNVNKTGSEVLVSSEYPVFTSTKKGDLGYLIPMLNGTARFRYFCRTQKMGGTRTRLYYKNLCTYKTAFATLPEQQKIAEILSAQDKLIALKEKLIEEKKRQKKALMQQLLTGKKRLPGFSGEWKQVKLGDICSTFSGGTPNRSHSEYYGGDIPWIKSGELNHGDIYDTEETLTDLGLNNSSAKIAPKGTLLIAMYGATAGILAFTHIDAAINQAILALIPTTKVSTCFIKESLDVQIETATHRLTQGGQPNFNASIIESFSISMPCFEEQEAISNIAKTADHEIALLNDDLYQEKQKKKTLMQLLLTGIVRV